MEILCATSRGRCTYSSTGCSYGTTTTDDVAAHATTTYAVTNDVTARHGNAIANDGWWYARNDARSAAYDGRNAGYDATTTHDGRHARNDASTNARDDGYVATNDGGYAWNDADDGRYVNDVILFYYHDNNLQLFFHDDEVLINFYRF